MEVVTPEQVLLFPNWDLVCDIYVTKMPTRMQDMSGHAGSVEEWLAAPQLATVWKVTVNGAYLVQPAVKITAI